MKKKIKQYKNGGKFSRFLQGAYGALDGVLSGVAGTVGLGGAYEGLSNITDRAVRNAAGKNYDINLVKKAEGIGTLAGGVGGGLLTGNVVGGLQSAAQGVMDLEEAGRYKTAEDQAQYRYNARKKQDTSYQDIAAGITSLASPMVVNRAIGLSQLAFGGGMANNNEKSITMDTTYGSMMPDEIKGLNMQNSAFNQAGLGMYKMGGKMCLIGGKMYEMGGVMNPMMAGNVEGGEVMQTPMGQVQEINGNKHSEGGVNVSAPVGTFVFSDAIPNDKVSFADVAAKMKKNMPNDKFKKLYGSNNMFVKNADKAVNQALEMLQMKQELFKQMNKIQ